MMIKIQNLKTGVEHTFSDIINNNIPIRFPFMLGWHTEGRQNSKQKNARSTTPQSINMAINYEVYG